MGVENINSVYDIPAIEAEQQAFTEALKKSQKSIEDLYAGIQKFKGTNIVNLGKDTEDLQKRLQASESTISELQDKYNKLQEAQEKTRKKTKELTLEQAIQQEQTKKNNTELRNQAKETIAVENSYEKLDAKIKSLTAASKKMDLNSEEYKAVTKEIADMDTQLKELDATQGRFNRNVGNYPGAAKMIVDALEKEKQKLEELEKKRISVQNAGSSFHPAGAVNNQLSRTTITGFAGGNQAAGQEIKGSVQNLQVLDTQIEESRTVIEGFARQLKELASTNVAASLAPAFNVLEKELEDLRAKMGLLKKSDPGFAKLAQEEKLLTQITAGLSRSFGNPTQELRAMQNAAKNLGSQLGLTNKTYRDFVASVGERKDELEDIQNTINFQASDTKYLDGIVSAVNGLVGVYGAAQSAAALFGDDSEETAKTMQKLQAITALVTSLQAVQNAVMTDGAAVQSVLAARTGLLNAAKQVQALFTAEVVAATQADVVATTELVATETAATAAAGTQAAATQAVAVANTEAATTAVAATTATKGFSTALIASGIGAAIVVIGAAIAYLVKVSLEWASSGTENIENQKKLADVTVKMNEVLIAQSKIIAENDQTFKRYYENQLNLATAAGENEYKIFARRKTLAEENKRLAKDEIDRLGATNSAYAGVQSNIESIQSKILLTNTALDEALSDGDDRKAEAAQKLMEMYDTQLNAIQPLYSAMKSARETLFNSNAETGRLEIEQAKFEADEIRKVVLETAKLNQQAIIDSNDRVLSNEKSTLDQRLKAIVSSAIARRAVAQAEFDNVKNDPGTTDNELLIARKNLNYNLAKIDKEAQDNRVKQELDFANRSREANKRVEDARLNDIIFINNEIAQQEGYASEVRISAAIKVNDAKKKLIEDEYKNQKASLDQKAAADGEYEALEADKNSRLAGLAVEGSKTLLSIQDSLFQERLANYDKYNESIARKQAEANLAIADQYSNDVFVLSDQLKKKQITYQEYLKALEKLDREAAIHQMQNQAKALKLTLDGYGDLESRIGDIRQKIADTNAEFDKEENETKKLALKVQLELYKKDLEAYIKVQAAKGAALKDYKEIIAQIQRAIDSLDTDSAASELDNLSKKIEAFGALVGNIIGTINEVANIGFDRDKAKIEEQNAAQEKRYEDEAKRINNLNIKDEERADRLRVLEGQRTQEKEINDRKLRKIEAERARFQKAADIANIITSTTLAVVRTLGDTTIVPGYLRIPLAVTVGALGAAQLARAIAAPVPSYFDGTEDHPGGPAIVHAGEIVHEPGKSPIYTGLKAETLLPRLAKGSVVYTADEVNKMMYADMMRQTAAQLEFINGTQHDTKFDRLTDAVNRQTTLVVDALNKKKPINVHNHNSGHWGDYLEKKVYN